MRKFILQSFLFVLPIILMGYLVDVYLSNTLKKSNSYTGEFPTWNAVLDGKVNSQIVICGSSRAVYHFDPILLEKQLNKSAFNLGVNGHSFKLQNLRNDLFLEKNRLPQLIIYSVDARTLATNKELYNPDQFLPYLLWNSKMETTINCYETYNWFDYKIPLIRFYGKFTALKTIYSLSLHSKINPILRIKGYKGNEAVWNNDFEKAKIKLGKYKTDINASLKSDFEKFIQNYQSKKIKIVLIYSPEYIDGQKFIINRNESVDIFKSFAKKYNLLYLDFAKDSICLDKKYFYNASHLNKTGAELFTSKVADTIQKLKILKD